MGKNKETKLTDKQEAFVIEYLKCFNAAKAAKLAGYEGNSGTLAAVGYENLNKPHIASRVQAYMKQYAMSAAEVLYRLSEIGRADSDDLVDDNGNPDIKKAREAGKTGLIKKIRTRTITGEESDIVENELELHDKVRALELIGKHYKMFTDKTELSTEDGKPIPILITGMNVDEL